jgi:16S rRNA (guanine527-N7)-methyltransferase
MGQRRDGQMSTNEDRLRERLGEGLVALGLALGPTAIAACIAYLQELERWNRAYNLTAVRDVEAMVPRHLLDSLAVHRYVTGACVADAGTGAGLPVLPLAIAAPERRYTLIDGGAKKVRFLRHVVARLALAQVDVVHSRLEDYPAQAGFDTVTARALAPLSRMLELTGHLCRPGGRILAMQGRRQDDELRALPAGWKVEAVEQLAVPQLDAQRHVVILRRAPLS